MSPENKSALLSRIKAKWPILLLALLGLVLLLISGGGESKQSSSTADPFLATEQYRSALENELSALCRHVTGVGRLEMMITLDGTAYAHYATDRVADGREEYVTVGGNCVLLSEEYPDVIGVAVVCDGGGDAAVCRELTELICAALDIGSNRVHIAPYA